MSGGVVWAILCSSSRASASHCSSWLVCGQQLAHLAHQHIPYTQKHIRNVLGKLAEPHKRLATPAEVAWLASKQVVAATAHRVTLIRVPAAIRVLSSLGVPGHVLSALGAMKAAALLPSPAQQQPVAPPTPQPAAHPPPCGPCDTFYPCIQLVLPNHLPLVTLTHEEVTATRYGLTTQAGFPPAALAAVHAELQQLKDWCCSPIQLNRPKSLRLLAAPTWQGFQGELLRFLGYCRLHQGVQAPSLHHCLNGNLVMHFISFLRARQVQPQGLADFVGNASRVVLFLLHTHQLSQPCRDKVAGYLEQLATLQAQLGHNLQPLPATSLAQQQQQGKWMEPERLLMCITKVHEHAQQLLPGPGPGQAFVSRAQAVTIMEACLCCSLFGYLSPMRPSILITLQQPSYEGPCLWPSCQHKDTCQGNRLEWVVEPGSSSSSRWGQLRLVAPHHKTSNHAKERAISFTLPADLLPLYSYHLQAGLGKVWELHTHVVDDEVELPPSVFINPNTCKQLVPQQVSQVWSRVVLPDGFAFGPQTARAAFTTLVREDARLTGVSAPFVESAAAEVMGNSLVVWDGVYDRLLKCRQAQEAINTMTQWRQGVLARVAQGVGHTLREADEGVVVISDSESESEPESEQFMSCSE